MRLIKDNSERRLLAGPIALLVALLAGCGGGGGGGGGGSGLGPTTPIGFSYPTLAAAPNTQIAGFSSAYTLTGNLLTSTGAQAGGTVSASRNGTQFTFIVTGIPLPAQNTVEPQFQFTVDFANTALPGVTIAGASRPGANVPTACTECFRSPPTAPVEFTYLDLNAAGLVYSTLGVWSKQSILAGTQVGGAFAFGVPTRAVDLPTTGSANYTGPFVGRYAGTPQPEGTPNVYTVGAHARAQVDFGTSLIDFSTTGTNRTSPLGTVVQDANLNLSGTLRINAGQISAVSLTTAGYNMNVADVKAGFFGPPAPTAPFAPPELGGALAIRDAGNTQSMVGSFALKKTP